MLMEIEMFTEDELKGKVAVIRVSSDEEVHSVMNQINAFQSRRPDLAKVFSFMVLPKNMEIRDVMDVAQEMARKAKDAPASHPMVENTAADRAEIVIPGKSKADAKS